MIAKLSVTNPRVSAYSGPTKIPISQEQLLQQASEEEDSEDSPPTSVNQNEQAERPEEVPEPPFATPEERTPNGAVKIHKPKQKREESVVSVEA